VVDSRFFVPDLLFQSGDAGHQFSPQSLLVQREVAGGRSRSEVERGRINADLAAGARQRASTIWGTETSNSVPNESS
jgi:hypothetical protein